MSEEGTALQPGGGGGGDGAASATARESPPDIQTRDGADDDDADADAGLDNGNDNSGSSCPPPRKRRRTVISCTECHRRKQKCDRKLPCTNCISRHKQDGCKYESAAPTAREQQKRRAIEDGEGSNNGKFDNDGLQDLPTDSIPTKLADFGYSQTGASTLGFLQKLEHTNPDDPLPLLNPDNVDGDHGDNFSTRERYKSLIRQLPARTYIDKLVDIYFIEFNWQYHGLDRDVFDRHLSEWYKLPFTLLTNGGPQALEPNLRAFPGLLFQVLALAILLLRPEAESTFESLKYAGSMSFEDLAADYSESGMAILSLLGKRQMTITTVLAGFLRASFLKYIAMVTESWHAIGSAIRDAQEIGLHRESLDPKPKDSTAEAIIKNQWEIQRRRQLWATLIWWDIHTALVLGRPTTIDHSQGLPTLPIDAAMNIHSKPASKIPIPLIKRTESDPPTPLTRILFAFEIGNQLRDVLALENEGPCPRDFSKVDAIHARMLASESSIPPWLRLENSDTRFDSLPQCYWLPYCRAQMPPMLAFNLMALHRPYIFSRPISRTEALKASLGMLQAQRYRFSTLKPHQYSMFSLFFGTFDAIVLVASIYILFPRENREFVKNAVQHFTWALDRFAAMSGRNHLAKAAVGVLKAIEVRFGKSLEMGMKVGGVDKGLVGGGGSVTSDNTVGVKSPSLIRPMTNAGLMPLPWADGDGPTASVSPESGFGSASSTAPSHKGFPIGSPQVSENTPNFTGTHAANTNTSNGPSPTSSSLSSSTPSSNNTHGTTRDTPRSWSYPASTPSIGDNPNATNFTDNNSLLFNTSTTDTATGGGGAAENWDWNLNLPNDFDWSSVQPIFATGDLLYNDLQMANGFLGGASTSHTTQTQTENGNGNDVWGASAQGGDINMLVLDGSGVGEGVQKQTQQGQGQNTSNTWQFEGDFGNDSVWNLLNQLGPFQ